jgi:hypothetical protein
MRVFICSPYRGDVERNVLVAEKLCRKAIREGHAPFAPHLLYTRFLDDDNEEERMEGIDAACEWLEVCDIVWVYTGNGITEGMDLEIEDARYLEKQVVEIETL